MEIKSAFIEWLESLPADREPEDVEVLLDEFIELFILSSHDEWDLQLEHIQLAANNFTEKNKKRWESQFSALKILIEVCLEAGQAFRQHFLAINVYKNDILLGTQMRIHARAVRVSKEILVLMENGYADGAFSRWRTLYELAVAALALQKHGKPAAIDYFLSGKVKALEGIEAYDACAEQMGYKTLPANYLSDTTKEVEELLARNERTRSDFSGDFGWLRKYASSSKRNKIEEHLGLTKWQHDYKWASQDVHSGYREMRALLGMSETNEDSLLIGPSDAGVIEPINRTAITLVWVTTAFVSTYYENEDSPFDKFDRVFWLKLVEKLLKIVEDTLKTPVTDITET